MEGVIRNEVRRGRKFIEYHDDEQPEGTFTQEVSGADVSYAGPSLGTTHEGEVALSSLSYLRTKKA